MGEWTVASQRKRGPTALHHRLWSGLPLLWIEFSDQRSSSRFWHMLIGGGQRQPDHRISGNRLLCEV
jgi:hypothetical protein